METQYLEHLFVRKWTTKEAIGNMIITHGYAEHSGRYEHVAQFFNNAKYNVYAYDLSGHGKSKGLTAYIEQFSQYLEDLRSVHSMVRESSLLPIFLLGHSMGGLITSMATTKNLLPEINGIILSNPALDIESNQPKILVAVIRILARIAPKMKTVVLDSKDLSKNPQVVQAYNDDPLVYRGGSRPGMVDKMDKAGKWMRENARSMKENILICYADTDKVVHAPASSVFYQNISSLDKSIKNYSGLYHEILNSDQKEEILNDILEWMNHRNHFAKANFAPENKKTN